VNGLVLRVQAQAGDLVGPASSRPGARSDRADVGGVSDLSVSRTPGGAGGSHIVAYVHTAEQQRESPLIGTPDRERVAFLPFAPFEPRVLTAFYAFPCVPALDFATDERALAVWNLDCQREGEPSRVGNQNPEERRHLAEVWQSDQARRSNDDFDRSWALSLVTAAD
jgi:hypothetical protein